MASEHVISGQEPTIDQVKQSLLDPKFNTRYPIVPEKNVVAESGGGGGVIPPIDPESGMPNIGANGNWFVGTVDTGVKAQGPKGDPGVAGADGSTMFVSSVAVTADGSVNKADLNGTGVGIAVGDYILDVDGQLVEVVTVAETAVTIGAVLATLKGPKGDAGTNGTDGVSPHIDTTSGNWFIGETDTGIKAQGPAGEQGPAGTNGVDGAKGDPGEKGADGFTATTAEITVGTAIGGYKVGDVIPVGTGVMDILTKIFAAAPTA